MQRIGLCLGEFSALSIKKQSMRRRAELLVDFVTSSRKEAYKQGLRDYLGVTKEDDELVNSVDWSKFKNTLTPIIKYIEKKELIEREDNIKSVIRFFKKNNKKGI